MTMKYRCDTQYDFRGSVWHCPNPAVLILGDKNENHNFCAGHVPDCWEEYVRFYTVENDEATEWDMSRCDRRKKRPIIAPGSVVSDGQAIKASDLRGIARELLERHYNEKMIANYIMWHGLGVKWEEMPK